MAPGARDLQLTIISGGMNSEVEIAGDAENVRLLDSYESEESGRNFEVSSRNLNLKVTGMTCAACSNSVEAALMAIPGISKAAVSLLQNTAVVVFDPAVVSVCDSSPWKF